MVIAVALVAPACASDQTIACPGQFDPGPLSDEQLQRAEIGRVPERGATDRETILETIAQRRAWLDENYEGVERVEAGQGWGVTHSRDELGNITFHREPDNIIVTTVAERANCPDPEKGTLLIFSPDNRRVPVRFVYRTS